MVQLSSFQAIIIVLSMYGWWCIWWWKWLKVLSYLYWSKKGGVNRTFQTWWTCTFCCSSLAIVALFHQNNGRAGQATAIDEIGKGYKMSEKESKSEAGERNSENCEIKALLKHVLWSNWKASLELRNTTTTMEMSKHVYAFIVYVSLSLSLSVFLSILFYI